MKREPVVPVPRPSMSKARRVRIFVKEDGRCYLCNEKVKIGDLFEVEHVIPWAISFDDSDENLKIAHTVCHKQMKTKGDMRDIAKIKRIIKKSDPVTRKPSRMQSRGFQKGQKTKWPTRKFEGKK